jgi:hypothetical protein
MPAAAAAAAAAITAAAELENNSAKGSSQRNGCFAAQQQRLRNHPLNTLPGWHSTAVGHALAMQYTTAVHTHTCKASRSCLTFAVEHLQRLHKAVFQQCPSS